MFELNQKHSFLNNITSPHIIHIEIHLPSPSDSSSSQSPSPSASPSSSQSVTFPFLSLSLDEAKAIATKAKDDGLVNQSQIANLDFYTKIMIKITEKGDAYAELERLRLQAILESDKVSEARKGEFLLRVNILGSFSPPEPLVVPGEGNG